MNEPRVRRGHDRAPTAIRVAVAVDEVGVGGEGPEEDVATITEYLESLLDAPVLVVDQVHSSHDLAGLIARDPEVEILAIDYGGLSSSYGAAYENAREMARLARGWADRHPGKVLAVWTRMGRYGSDEIAETFTGVENLIALGDAPTETAEAFFKGRFGPGDPAWSQRRSGVVTLTPPAGRGLGDD
jgi:hypothetical protein